MSTVFLVIFALRYFLFPSVGSRSDESIKYVEVLFSTHVENFVELGKNIKLDYVSSEWTPLY
jgi:hypothetical protein